MTKSFEVVITRQARRDLEEIYDYISTAESLGRADKVLESIRTVVDALETFPERGSHPGELLALGVKDYRQAITRPYRIIYQIESQIVTIVLIADGRRDMKALLQRRLLAPS